MECAEEGLAVSKMQRQSPVEPALHDRGCAFINADRSCAIALSMQNPSGPSRELQILWEQRESLRDSKPSAIHHRDERAVADACRCSPRARAQKALYLVLGERLRGKAAAFVPRGLPGRS